MQCKVCSLPFPEPCPSWMTIHDECKLCMYCNHEVGIELIEKRLRDHSASSRDSVLEPSTKPEIFHDYCKNQKLENDFKNHPVVITQAHLDMLNAVNLMFRPNTDLSLMTNQKEAELHSHKFVHEMTLEEKFITLKRLEAVAAMWSIALSKDKQRIQIQLDEKERVKHKELQHEGQRLEYEKKRERKAISTALSGNATPEEKQREKAIMAFTKLGMTREIAIQQLDSIGETTKGKTQ